MTTTLRARSLPYRTARPKERTCNRCGIQFRVGNPVRDSHLTECRDCRGAS